MRFVSSARCVLAALLAVAWLGAAQALTPEECKRATLAEGSALSQYLRDYAQDCLAGQAAAGVRALGVGADTATQDASAFVRAWHQVADAFDRLARSAASVGGEQPAQMPKAYEQLAARARTAGGDLGRELAARQMADVGVYGAVAWQRPARAIVLGDVKDAKGAVRAPLVDLDAPLDADCSRPASALCRQALADGRQLMLQLAIAQDLGVAIGKPTVEALKQQIDAKNALWDTYLYKSKPMLPFDFVLTDLLDGRWKQSDQYPQGFREPPTTQWFLLHPAVGVEYASGAVDGEHMKPVLYVEIVGANRWNPRDRWIDLPLLDRLSGVSLVASYVDRVGTDNSGTGVLLTFDNVYSIGVTRYGSTTGVFLTLDLANFYRDELRPSYESFKGDLSRRLRAR
jgi:hypothetical protein